jgi:hypothetical protein
MAKDRPKDFDEGPETTFREAFPTIKNIRVEVVQSDSFSWNPRNLGSFPNRILKNISSVVKGAKTVASQSARS